MAVIDTGDSGALVQGFGIPQLIITQGYSSNSGPPPPGPTNQSGFVVTYVTIDRPVRTFVPMNR